MKPRWLRAMIAIPSPSLDALVGERPGERVRAPVHLGEGERARLVDRPSTSSPWVIAAPAIPPAGEAPQRASSRTTRASLSGRIGRITPASASVFRLNGTSGSGAERAELDLAGERERVA